MDEQKAMEVLNHEEHGVLRLARANDADRHFVQIVASEFLDAMHHYPILFTKHPETGAFLAGVVMGLEPGENLLVDAEGALPGYRLADLERQGFFITDERVVIDPASPVFAAHGQPLFEADGTPALALRRVQRALQILHAGLPATDAIIRRFLDHRLLEPIDVSFDFDDGRKLRLEGLYTISLDALHALPDAVALELFRAGDLQIAYAQTGSVRLLRMLARRRNDRLSAMP